MSVIETLNTLKTIIISGNVYSKDGAIGSGHKVIKLQDVNQAIAKVEKVLGHFNSASRALSMVPIKELGSAAGNASYAYAPAPVSQPLRPEFTVVVPKNTRSEAQSPLALRQLTVSDVCDELGEDPDAALSDEDELDSVNAFLGNGETIRPPSIIEPVPDADFSVSIPTASRFFKSD